MEAYPQTIHVETILLLLENILHFVLEFVLRLSFISFYFLIKFCGIYLFIILAYNYKTVYLLIYFYIL